MNDTTDMPSVASFVLEYLIDKPGSLSIAIAAARKPYMSEGSVPAQLFQLYKRGVLRREPTKHPTMKKKTWAYWIDDLDKMPEMWRPTGYISRQMDPDAVRRRTVTPEPIPEPLNPAEQDTVHVPDINLPDTSPLVPQPSDHPPAQPRPASAPQAYIAIQTGEKVRRFTPAEARVVYTALRELFGE